MTNAWRFITGLPCGAAAAFGIVMTTERFSLVRYFFATRCTSAAVTFRIWSVRVLIRLGLLKNIAYSPSWMARLSVLVTCAAWLRRALLCAFSISQSAIGPFFTFSISS